MKEKFFTNPQQIRFALFSSSGWPFVEDRLDPTPQTVLGGWAARVGGGLEKLGVLVASHLADQLAKLWPRIAGIQQVGEGNAMLPETA